MPEQTSTVVVSHRSRSRLYLFFFFFFFAPVDVNCGGALTRHCQFALSRTRRKRTEKKTVAMHHATCAFSAAVAKLVRVKRFRAGVWKKLKGNNDSLGLSVME